MFFLTILLLSRIYASVFVTIEKCNMASHWSIGKSGTIGLLPDSVECITLSQPDPRSELTMTQCSDAPEQQFLYVNDTIKHITSGLCISVEHAQKKAGARLDVNKCDGTDNMIWEINKSTDTIIHKLSGLCMDGGGSPPPPTPAPVPPSPSYVYVNGTKILGRVDLEYVGVSYDLAAWLGLPFEGAPATTPPNLSNAFLRSVVSHLAPSRIRIGGGAGDCVTYMHPPSNKSYVSHYCKGKKYYDYGIRETEFEDLMSFCNATNLSLVFGLNAAQGRTGGSSKYKPWDPSNADQLLSLPSACAVTTYELGNEMRHAKVDVLPTAAQYGADFVTLSKLIKSKCSNKIAMLPTLGGTDQDLSSKDADKFLAATKGTVDYFVWHHYIASHATIQQMTTPLNLDATQSIGREYEKVIKKYGVTQWIGETSGSSNGGTPNVSNRYVDGVWWIDQLGALAQVGVTSQNRQSLLGGDYGILDYKTYQPNPSYFGAVLWKQLMGRTVLNTSTNTRYVSVRAYAHCHSKYRNGTITIALVNTAKSAVDVHFDDALDNSIRIRYLLTADSPNSPNVAINSGRILKVDTDGNLPNMDGQFMPIHDILTMAPLSYGFVVFPNAKINVCIDNI